MTESRDPPMTPQLFRLLEAGVSLGLQEALEKLLALLSPETRESLLKDLASASVPQASHPKQVNTVNKIVQEVG